MDNQIASGESDCYSRSNTHALNGTGVDPGEVTQGQPLLSFTGVVSVTLNFHPQGRNVNDVTNEGKG